jgi:hypothetical protein
VVGRGEPFQFTTSPLGTKFVPFTVSVIPAGLQAGVELDAVEDAESDVIVGSTIANATAFEVFALPAALATATWTVPTDVIFDAATAALNWVELTNAVVNCVTLLLLSVHCTPEHGRKPLPVTISEKAAVPAVAPTGDKEAIVAAAGEVDEIVKDAGAELTPAFDTVIEAVPEEAMSEAGIAAVSCVELRNVVARAEPFQFNTDALTKFVPFTVRVNPVAAQDGVVFDMVVEEDKEVIVGGAMVNAIPAEVPPPGLRVNTFT